MDVEKKILVVDDDVLLLRAYERILSSLHSYTLVTNAKDAIAELEKDNDYNIILLDVTMPVLDGIGLYKYLEKEMPHYNEKIIFCSGGMLSEDKSNFLKNLKNIILEKPVGKKEILEAISKIS